MTKSRLVKNVGKFTMLNINEEDEGDDTEILTQSGKEKIAEMTKKQLVKNVGKFTMLKNNEDEGDDTDILTQSPQEKNDLRAVFTKFAEILLVRAR